MTTKKQTKKTNGSMMSRMTQVKLPPSVYWLRSLDEILLVDDVEQSDAETCGCLNLKGRIYLSTRNEWSNEYEMSGKDCFETLQQAVDEVSRRKLIDEKKSFIYKHNRRNDTQADKIRLLSLAAHRSIVIDELVDQMKIDEGDESSVVLNRNTYRLALDNGGWKRMFPKIVDITFPTLIGVNSSEDDF